MVQVLPYVPTFLEQISPQIGNIIGAGAELYSKNRTQNKARQAIQGYYNQAQGGPGVNTGSPVGDLQANAPQMKPQDFSKLYELQKEGYGEEFANKWLQDQFSQHRDSQNLAAREQIKIREEERANQKELAPIKLMSEATKDLIQYSGPTNAITAPFFRPKDYEKRKELDLQGLTYADATYARVNKGVINKEKWNDIKTLWAPNSSLTQLQNQARVNALDRMNGLSPDVKGEKLEKILQKEQTLIDKSDKQAAPAHSAPEGKVAILNPKGKLVYINATQLESALASGGKMP